MNGDWGEEERDLERDFPFSPDQTFELVITVNELGYTVMYTQYSDQSQKCSFYLFYTLHHISKQYTFNCKGFCLIVKFFKTLSRLFQNYTIFTVLLCGTYAV